MKVRCINNTGESLRPFEYNPIISKEILGRFGVTGHTIYGGLTLGTEYLVMGLITFESYLGYLIDDNGLIFVCPCQLFEVIDDKICLNWHFRLVEKEEEIYPFVQAIFGYQELCLDRKSYENLIIEKEEEATRIYFKRKIEYEKLR